MLVSLKVCNFEHTELSIHFESLNDKSKLTRVNLQLNLSPSKYTNPVLKKNGYFFNTLK